MAIEIVRSYLKAYGKENEIIEVNHSCATVALAAQALHIEEKQIAKSLSFKVKDTAIIIVCAGNARIDNHAFKERFEVKARLLKAEEVQLYTNHEIGGVCPFGVPETTLIYLDTSLQQNAMVYPACGSANSSIALSIEEVTTYVPFVAWVSICKDEEGKQL